MSTSSLVVGLAALLIAAGSGMAPLMAQPAGGLGLVELASLAEQGDVRAAYLLGMHYTGRDGGARDDSEALKWLRRAADGELPEAQYNLAIMYATGRGIERDPAQAARWFQLAADQDYAPAQHALGTLYATGNGVPRDELQAARWLQRAAESGEVRAQYNLGVLYEYGRGVGMDASQAEAWYERAAAAGYEPAAGRLASLRERLGRAGGTPASPRAAPAASVGTSPLPPGEYTIQLASHTSRADAEAARKRYRLGRSARVVSTRVKGKRWFVLLYGAYPDREAAQAAVQGLSPALRQAEPWIRKVDAIREMLDSG